MRVKASSPSVTKALTCGARRRRAKMKPVRIYYPWLSTLGLLAAVAWQFLLANPDMVAGSNRPPWFWQDDKLLIAGALLLLLVVFDGWRFLKASARYREQLAQYQEQIGELFDSKRELGTRARTYSDHADKLKMFISERLLEYIEYDEKFLHFKNIASEVRHNGVISYDKAQTALKTAPKARQRGARRRCTRKPPTACSTCGICSTCRPPTISRCTSPTRFTIAKNTISRRS